MKISYHFAKFGFTIGTLVVKVYLFSLSHGFDVLMSPTPARLVSFKSTPLDVSAFQIWLS